MPEQTADMTSSELTSVKPSPVELKTKQWSSKNLRAIVDAVRTDGVVVLEGVIDPSHLDELNQFMVPDAERIAKGARRNFGTMNIQQGPPLQVKELLYEDIFFNKLLFEAVSQILGPSAKFDFISGNTALPESTQKQPTHSDQWAAHIKSATFYLVANIPLIDSTIETGATQIWPGTHLLRNDKYLTPSEGSAIVGTSTVESRRLVVPPVQPTVRRGSIILRDLTLWHNGMPNPSSNIRCMIAFGFSAKWYNNITYFKVPSVEVSDLFAKEAAQHGIEVKTQVYAENFNVEKDFHDFSHAEVD